MQTYVILHLAVILQDSQFYNPIYGTPSILREKMSSDIQDLLTNLPGKPLHIASAPTTLKGGTSSKTNCESSVCRDRLVPLQKTYTILQNQKF